MTAIDTASIAPDLVIPSGRIELRIETEVDAAIRVSVEGEELEVILPAGTKYFLEIGRTFRARWRPNATALGIWSFWCEVGSEKAWLETDGTSWQINHSLTPPDVEAQSSPVVGS